MIMHHYSVILLCVAGGDSLVNMFVNAQFIPVFGGGMGVGVNRLIGSQVMWPVCHRVYFEKIRRTTFEISEMLRHWVISVSSL